MCEIRNWKQSFRLTLEAFVVMNIFGAISLDTGIVHKSYRVLEFV